MSTRTRTFIAVIAATLLIPMQAHGEEPSPDVLPAPAAGPAAVASLGSDLAEVARRNDMSVSGLTRLLSTDPTVWVQRDGALVVTEPATSRAAVAQLPPEAPPFPLTETFRLHSRPGSQRVIFIDFDGADVTGTRWNRDYAMTPGFYPGMDYDGDPASWSIEEHGIVQSVFQRVAEDYAPFDVDVTTEDPGADAITRSSVADLAFGTTVYISSSSPAANLLCQNACEGVAFMNGFNGLNKQGSQPAWVFSQKLRTAKTIADAASHEVGHTLGLSHDGTGSTVYYRGNGSGWAPIMGIGYDEPVVQFSKGEYPDAGNPEDDFAVIGKHGLAYRPDDAGPRRATAKVLGRAPSFDGVIEKASDIDVLAIDRTCSSTTRIDARPVAVSPNLDISLRLLAADGKVLAAADAPLQVLTTDLARGLQASIKTDLPPGRYYVEVSGVGAGTTAAGYSDYGSVGQYSLRVSRCTAG